MVKCIGEWLHKPLPESPQLCLLGDRFVLPPCISKQKFGLALAGFIGASRNSQVKPIFDEWLKLMTDIASFESLIARTTNYQGKF